MYFKKIQIFYFIQVLRPYMLQGQFFNSQVCEKLITLSRLKVKIKFTKVLTRPCEEKNGTYLNYQRLSMKLKNKLLDCFVNFIEKFLTQFINYNLFYSRYRRSAPNIVLTGHFSESTLKVLVGRYRYISFHNNIIASDDFHENNIAPILCVGGTINLLLI